MESLSKFLWLRYSAAGLLLGVGFFWPTFWILSIVGAAYFLLLTQREQSRKSLLIGGWLTFSLKASLALTWFWSTYPIIWLPVEIGKIQLLILFIYWFSAALWIGTGGILIAYLLKFFKLNNPISFFAIPIIWIAGELFGSIFFSIITLGAGSNINSQFSFGYVGYLLAENNFLIKAAAIGGVFSLSFLFITMTLGLLLVLRKVPIRFRYLVLGTSMFLLALPSFSINYIDEHTPEEGGQAVALIETDFSVDMLRSREGVSLISTKLGEAVRSALELEPGYIILPEDSRFFNQAMAVASTKAFFKFQYKNPSAVIVDSGRVGQDENTFVQAFIYDGVTGEVNKIRKSYLVPQGEYVPYLYANAFKLLGFGEAVQTIEKDISYKLATSSSQVSLDNQIPGILFCFESVSPTAVKRLTKERPAMPFIAHPVSHAWFHEPDNLWHQLDTMLRVQAIWSKVYIVSASSHAESKVYTPTGGVLVPDVVAEGQYWKVRLTRMPKK